MGTKACKLSCLSVAWSPTGLGQQANRLSPCLCQQGPFLWRKWGIMSLGGYRARLRAESKSIQMLATESLNSADLQWCLKYYPESHVDTPGDVCVCVYVWTHGHTGHARAFSSPFVCLLLLMPFIVVTCELSMTSLDVRITEARKAPSQFAI